MSGAQLTLDLAILLRGGFVGPNKSPGRVDLVRRVGVILCSKDRYRVLKVSKRGRGGFQRVLAGLQERTQG